MKDERRQHERIPVDLLLTYEIEEVPTGVSLKSTAGQSLTLVNISRGGTCFLTEQRLAKGVVLKISLTPLLVPGTMQITGKVAWTEDLEDFQTCGIQFLSFAEGSKAVFDDYLTKLETTPAEELARLIQEAEDMEEF